MVGKLSSSRGKIILESEYIENRFGTRIVSICILSCTMLREYGRNTHCKEIRATYEDGQASSASSETGGRRTREENCFLEHALHGWFLSQHDQERRNSLTVGDIEYLKMSWHQKLFVSRLRLRMEKVSRDALAGHWSPRFETVLDSAASESFENIPI